MIKSAIFDFDGTLVDSNDIKYNEFLKYSELEFGGREVMEKLLKTKSYDRYDIWRIYGKELRLNSQEIKKRITEFNLALRREVSRANEKKGATEILKNFQNMGISLYVSSMTPKLELELELRSRDWLKYLVDVFGSPNNKSKTVRSIIEKSNLKNSELIVIGDGQDDFRSAHENKVNFYPVGNFRSFENADGPYNLEEISEFILN